MVFAVRAERTTDEPTVDQLGKPDPALVITCPLVPAAPLSVRAVVKLAEVNTGAVSVLLVSVSVLVAVTMLLGVIIPDRVVMFYSGCVGQTTVFGNPACAGTSRSA